MSMCESLKIIGGNLIVILHFLRDAVRAELSVDDSFVDRERFSRE